MFSNFAAKIEQFFRGIVNQKANNNNKTIDYENDLFSN
jgi:hypothetical protein